MKFCVDDFLPISEWYDCMCNLRFLMNHSLRNSINLFGSCPLIIVREIKLLIIKLSIFCQWLDTNSTDDSQDASVRKKQTCVGKKLLIINRNGSLLTVHLIQLKYVAIMLFCQSKSKWYFYIVSSLPWSPWRQWMPQPTSCFAICCIMLGCAIVTTHMGPQSQWPVNTSSAETVIHIQTRLIPLSKISWILASPSHQQRLYWITKINVSLSSMRRDFCHLSE